MTNKKEKGFALVLSLVLLMAMSLMGGALIVISASDHQSNNSVSYTHLPSPRDLSTSRMPSSA